MSPDKVSESNNAGSSNFDEPVFLVIGQFGRPHGVRGEIQFRPFTDFPERLTPGKVILVGDSHTPYTIKGVRGAVSRMILSFEGIADRDQAALLRNELVFVDSSELPDLDEGEYYHHELLGLRILTEDGQDLGVLSEIIDTPANEVFLVLRSDGSELLLPAIDDVILEIDPEGEAIYVRVPAGL